MQNDIFFIQCLDQKRSDVFTSKKFTVLIYGIIIDLIFISDRMDLYSMLRSVNLIKYFTGLDTE